MSSTDDLHDDILRNIRLGDSDDLFTCLNRLKILDSRTWHDNCTNDQPLVMIKDSVLSSVNVIINLNLHIQDVIDGKISPESFFQQHEDIKNQMKKLENIFSKAAIWMKSTQQDRWLHQLMKATENSSEERTELISLLTKASEENRAKVERINAIKEEIRVLRMQSRALIEKKWEDRHSFQRKLNEKQKEATQITEGRLVITAGPGSGKTHVLVERIVNLIDSGTKPSRILMLTFTVKATSEMSSRVEKKLGFEISEIPTIMNFNSFCKHMIDSDFEAYGFDKMPIHINPRMRRYLFDDLRQEQIDQELFEQIDNNPDLIDITLRLDDLLHNRSTNVDDLIVWFEEQILTPAENEESDLNGKNLNPSEELSLKRLTFVGLRLITPLRNFIRKNNGLTFGDQITLFHTRLKNDPSYLEKICSNFDHVLVDEFQDNNQSQGEIIKLMSNYLKSTCVVGDPNQAIFAFRGANVRNLQDFISDFSDSNDLKLVHLDTCYRHSQQVVNYSKKLIATNQDNFEMPDIKSGWINSDTTEVVVQTMIDEASEAVEHGIFLERKNLLGYEWDEMAVLSRSLNYVTSIIDYFELNEIPYVTTSSGNLFRDEVTIEAGMILRACIDPVGNAQAIGFLLKNGFMGVTKEDAEIVTRRCKYNPQKLFDSLLNIDGKLANRKTIISFYNFIDSNKKLPTITMEDWLFSTLKESGIISKMIVLGAENPLSKLVSLLLSELSTAGDFFKYPDRFANFIKQLMEGKIELEIDQISKPGHIVVSTIHKAKGLEWPIVVMPSLDNRRSPPKKVPEKAEKIIIEGFFKENSLDERQKELVRIFYVGLTRVQDLIRLSRPLTRIRKSHPNILFSVGCKIFDVDNIEIIHPSIMQKPLSINEKTLINLQSKLDESFEELRYGYESEDLSNSVRSLIIYHLEQLAVNEHSINDDLRLLLQNLESVVGHVEYSEFTEDAKFSEIGFLWKPKRYTWSMLDSYRRCPKQFEFTYVHKLVSSNNKSLIIGNLVHEIVEGIGSLPAKPDMKELDDIVRTSISNHINKLPLLNDVKIQEIIDSIAIWNSTIRARNKVIAIEKGIEFEFCNRKFYGKLDRVEIDSEDNLRIIDFKTGKANNKKPGNKNQEQLLLYAYAWKQHTGESPDIIAYDFIMEDKLVESVVTPIKLEKGLSTLFPIIEGIDQNLFSATPSEQTCKYCNFAGLCPDRK